MFLWFDVFTVALFGILKQLIRKEKSPEFALRIPAQPDIAIHEFEEVSNQVRVPKQFADRCSLRHAIDAMPIKGLSVLHPYRNNAW